MNDRDDTSFWNASPLCGEVFFAGWPQWTAHEDQVDSAKYLLFRVFEVEEIYFILFFDYLAIYNLHAYAFALGLAWTQAFRQYLAGSRQNRYRHLRCVILTRHNL